MPVQSDAPPSEPWFGQPVGTAAAPEPDLAPIPAPPPAAKITPEPARPPRPSWNHSAPVAADDRMVENFAEQIDVPAGQSVIVRLSRPAERVAISDPEVADVVLVNPREILVNGRGRRHTSNAGDTVIQEAQTSLIVWDKQGRSDLRDLYVSRSRPEQIELRVTLAELNRSALENAGFDFHVMQDKIFISGTPAKIAKLGALSLPLSTPIPSGARTITDAVTPNSDRLTFSVLDLNDNFLAFIELLQRESMAKVLARPTLLTRSGESAHFRSGGEVPIPLVTNNQVAVQFKEFGSIIDFTPVFNQDSTIDLKVSAELSEPDRTISQVSVGGFAVPGFKSRQTSTRVRLRDGQSLLIAGLLRDDESEDEQKVPYLGDLPYLGALFRTTSFTHLRTELLILVQPHVAPMDRDDSTMALPTERGGLSRGEVRTRPTPNPVTRPRLTDQLHPRSGGAPVGQPPEGAEPSPR